MWKMQWFNHPVVWLNSKSWCQCQTRLKLKFIDAELYRLNKEHITLFGRIQRHSLKTIQVPIQVNAFCRSNCPWLSQRAFVLPWGIHGAPLWRPLKSGTQKAHSWMFLRTLDTLRRNYSSFMGSGSCERQAGTRLRSSAAEVPAECGQAVSVTITDHTAQGSTLQKMWRLYPAQIVSLRGRAQELGEVLGPLSSQEASHNVFRDPWLWGGALMTAQRGLLPEHD